MLDSNRGLAAFLLPVLTACHPEVSAPELLATGQGVDFAADGSFTITVSDRTVRFDTTAIGDPRRLDAEVAGPWMGMPGGATRAGSGGIVETVRNTAEGVQQSWRFDAAPPGGVHIAVNLTGMSFVGESGAGLHFATADQRVGLRYSYGIWIDASGTTTHVPVRFAGNRIVLEVPDEVAAASSYPAMLDPWVSPELGMGEVVYGPGRSNGSGDVAALGSGALAVWTDERQRSGRIYAARLSASGTPQEVGGFAVATATSSQSQPAVACAATQCLVAWVEGYGDIKAALLSDAGTVLKQLVVATDFDDLMTPDVAFDGTNYLVVWAHSESRGGEIEGVRVSTAGTVIDAPVLLISTASSTYADIQLAPSVAWNGAHYLVAWYDHRGNTWSIYINRLSAQGAVLDGTGLALTPDILGEYSPAVASDGTNFLVTWSQYPSTGSDTTLFGRLVSDAGTPLGTSDLVITDEVGSQSDPELAFDGANYLVAWTHGGTPDSGLHGTRVTPAGAVLDSPSLSIVANPGSKYDAALAFSSGQFFMTWTDYRNGGSSVYASRVSSAGVALDDPDILLPRAPNNQDMPAVAYDGANFLVVWSDDRAGGDQIYAARVGPTGELRDPSGIPVSGKAYTDPAAAWGGSNYLVVWGGNDLVGRRIDPSGAVLDPADHVLADHAYRPQIASNGTDYLVAWSESTTGTNGYDIWGVRVGRDGEPLDTTPLVISNAVGNQWLPEVAYASPYYLVVWHDYRSSPSHIYGARVDSAGAVLDPAGILVTPPIATEYQTDATVASNGSEFLVAWDDSRESRIWGTRVSTAGAVLDPSGVKLTTGTTDHLHGYPKLAFDGTNYVVAYRNAIYLGGLDFDYQVKGTWVQTTASGIMPLTTATLVASTDEVLLEPVIGAGNNTALAAYSLPLTVDGLPLDRVRARLMAETPPNGACTSATQCPSGFCVDGFCCNSACGGNSTTDCTACSVFAGATANGTCGPVNTGRPCSDGNVCTSGDTCSAGVCAGSLYSCDDGNTCTTDACNGTGGCAHTQRSNCCNSDPDCVDSQVCTVDSCSGPGGTCSHSAITGCCTSASQCNDSVVCTDDTCDSSTQRCVHTPRASCCSSAADCNDINPCTQDSCTTSTGACNNQPVGGCCITDGDCADADACTLDQCSGAGGTCSHSSIGQCCNFDWQCNDSQVCTDDLCNPTTHVCSNSQVAGCCSGNSDCADSDPCTTDTCSVQSGLCSHQVDTSCGPCACDVDSTCTANCACDAECPCACDVFVGCDDNCACDPDCLEEATSGCSCSAADLPSLAGAGLLMLFGLRRRRRVDARLP